MAWEGWLTRYLVISDTDFADQSLREFWYLYQKSQYEAIYNLSHIGNKSRNLWLGLSNVVQFKFEARSVSYRQRSSKTFVLLCGASLFELHTPNANNDFFPPHNDSASKLDCRTVPQMGVKRFQPSQAVVLASMG